MTLILYTTSDDNGRGAELVSIDKLTGAATVIGSYGVEDVDGLTFASRGLLYGITGNSNRGNTTDSHIYTIDRTTGQAAEVNRLDRVRDYEATACPSAVSATRNPPLLSVLPSQGRADRQTEIAVNGSNFAAGDRVRLSNAWLPTTFISTTQLRARVHSELAPGSYDVMVARTDGTISVLPSAYRVFVPFNQYIALANR